MNDLKLSPDDPKLTAYALGELEGIERARIEYALGDDPAAQALVAHIQAMAAELETVFEAEPVTPALPTPKTDAYGAASRRKLARAPQIIYVFGGLAAACFALVLALQEPPIRKAPKTYYEVTMPALELPTSEGEIVETISGKATPFEMPAESVVPSAFAVTTGGLVEQSMRAFRFPSHFDAGPGGPLAAGDWFDPPPSGETRLHEHTSNGVLRSGARRETVGAVVTVLDRGAAGKFEAEARTQPASLRLANTDNVRSFGPRSLPPRRMKVSLEQNRPLGFTTPRGVYRPESEFTSAAQHPVSTFSTDVETASYSSVRRFIQRGILPPADVVRIEELLNYFSAQPPLSVSDAHNEAVPPFAARMEVAESPWTAGHRLVRIDVKARELPKAARRAANLVFLIDGSGSMNAPDKLPLVQESLRRLVGRLRPDDRVAIVTSAGASGRVLPSTPVANAREIAAALIDLNPAGSTDAVPGVQLAYDIARANFVSDGINRVILCTDGSLDLGVTDVGDLVRLAEEQAKSGVFLSVLGLGAANSDDSTLQQIADRGNGTYEQVDSRRAAEKMLSQQVNETLAPIASDVKLQVNFNPETVASYRLIGYEKRLSDNEDLRPATVEGSDVDAGHTVTALYEIAPIDRGNAGVGTSEMKSAEEPGHVANRVVAAAKQPSIAEPQTESHDLVPPAANADLLTLEIRYRELASEVSKKLLISLVDQGRRFSEASDDFKFAAAVAGFGMILRDSPHKGLATLAAVRSWAEAGRGYDHSGYRTEFVDLVRRTEALQ